jgi:hypothetical protein
MHGFTAMHLGSHRQITHRASSSSYSPSFSSASMPNIFFVVLTLPWQHMIDL